MTAVIAHPDTAICDGMTQLLSGVEGWRVYCAANGGEAVRIALVALPQLVLLNPHLQGMTGVATIASLRAHGISCPVVALVQHSDQDREQWYDQGYAGAVVLTNWRTQLVPHLRSLLDPQAP